MHDFGGSCLCDAVGPPNVFCMLVSLIKVPCVICSCQTVAASSRAGSWVSLAKREALDY